MINFGFDSVISFDKDGKLDVPYPNLFTERLYDFSMETFKEKYGDFPIQSDLITEQDYNFLNGRSICHNLNNDLYTINKNTVDYYIETNQNFLYPLLIWDNKLFDLDLNIPEKVKTQIYLGKCKFVIFYITEPWFMYEHCFVWLSNFSSKHGFNKNNFIFVSSNLKSNELKHKFISSGTVIDNFSIVEFNYHFHRLWISPARFHEPHSKEIYQKILTDNLAQQKNTEKEKHFLCFNRRSHNHRIATFAELMTNEKLKNKSILSIGDELTVGGNGSYKSGIRKFIDENYKHGHERLYNFIDQYDGTKGYLYDIEMEHVWHSIPINFNAHFKTFCNIVTETNTSEDVLFLTEKITKPMFALQPFVVIGSRNTLKTLKDLGFKTFDRWWDESYDNEKYQTRFEKVIDTLEEIASWDNEKIKKTLLEMEETLIHNFNTFLEDNSTKIFFNKFLELTQFDEESINQ